MKNIHHKRLSSIFRFLIISTILLLFSLPLTFNIYSEPVETPESFMARKKSTYEAALEALKKEYRKWCVVAGKPIVPPGGGLGQPPGGLGQPPGGLGQPPGEYAGGFGGFQEVFTGDELYYEIEQVMNTWASPDGSNPFSWADVNGSLFQVSRLGSSSSSSGGDQCTGRTLRFDPSSPGGPYAGIVLNETTKSCRLVGFSATSSTVYFNALVNKYQYGVGDATWTGPSANIAMYGTTYIKQYSKGGQIATIKFYVNNSTPANPATAVLGVTSVNW